MNKQGKKPYAVFLIIFSLIAVATVYFISNWPQLEYHYPSEDTILVEDDFILKYGEDEIKIGNAKWEEIKAVFPNGESPGRSMVYHPEGIDCYLTFTKKENILNKVDILSSQISTSRGIVVNDGIDKVVEAYGKNYAKISDLRKPEIYELMYEWNENYIVFHMTNDKVEKIILQHQLY